MSDYATDIMDLIAKHFEMSDRGKGKYQNNFMPPEKVAELLNDLWKYTDKVHLQSKAAGQKEMLVGLTDLFNKLATDK